MDTLVDLAIHQHTLGTTVVAAAPAFCRELPLVLGTEGGTQGIAAHRLASKPGKLPAEAS